jgi:SAM-dependent methyltransferase
MSSIDESLGRTVFGADPAGYDAARPGYPPELFAWLTEAGALKPGIACFEIGPGTGQASRPVLDHGASAILAFEPDPSLAAHLRARVPDPRLDIRTETFEDGDLPDDAFDLGFAATSFHWLPRGKALRKALRVLKPGGWLAIWWNVYHDPRRPDAFGRAAEPLFEGLEQLLSPDSTPFGLDAPARTGEMRSAGFKDVRAATFSQTLDFTPDGVAALYASFSRVAKAPPARREHLLSETRRIAREDFGGRVTRRIDCGAYLGRRP